jgi:hypothetical protein
VKYDIEVNQTNLKSSDGDIIGWNTQGGDYSSVALGTYSADEAQVLDLAMSDGTFLRVWSEDADELAANVAAIGDDRASDIVGIVYWVSTETDYPTRDDKLLARDYPWCTHGYILALKDAHIGSVPWQSEDCTESVYEKFQSVASYPDDIYQSVFIKHTNGTNDSSTQLSKALGYNNTQVLRAYNYYGCDSDHKILPIEELDEFVKTHKSPEGSSGWFLPSPKEMVLMVTTPETIEYDVNYGGSDYKAFKNLTNVMGKISIQYEVASELETAYWSSTEGAHITNSNEYDGYAWYVAFSYKDHLGYVDIIQKDQFDADVRAVCAF